MEKKALGILAIAISVSILYSFVIRPMQKDKKLEECIYGAGVSLGADEKFVDYEKRCIEKYGR